MIGMMWNNKLSLHPQPLQVTSYRVQVVDRTTVGQHSASGAIHGSWIGF